MFSRPPFSFRSRWLGLALGLSFLAALPAQAALPCRATASSSNAGQAGTTAANTIDGSTATFLQTGFLNWQHVQLQFECEIEISGFRRSMSKGSATTRNNQGEQILVSLDGVTWTTITAAASSGWQTYGPYSSGQAWSRVPYGWSAWLRPTTPLRARYLRFRWDGDSDVLNELDLDARSVVRIDTVKLTQNGLITRALPPMPIVAGKTTLVLGRLAALTGGPTRADAARIEIFRQDTGALVGSAIGHAIAADDRSLLPAIATGDEVHFFIPGSALTVAGPLRFEALLTTAGGTHRQVLLSNVTTAENEGVSLMIIDHDEGALRGLTDLLRFADVMTHTARIYPVKDSHGELLPVNTPTRGALGLRYEYTMNLALPAQGSQGDPRREFVLSNYTQGDTCSANPPNRTFYSNRVLPINFTGVEDLDRNGAFSAAEVSFCNAPAGNPAIGQRYGNFFNRVTTDQGIERNRVALRDRVEVADYTLSLLSGGGNRQNPSGFLGAASPRSGWATLTGAPGINYPTLPHELLHEIGLPHSNNNALPGPAYDLTRKRRVRQPFDVMTPLLGFTVQEAFLNDAQFDAARAAIPAASAAEVPRAERETLGVTGVFRADHSIGDLEVRVQAEELLGETLRNDLQIALLDELGEELVSGPAELLPPGTEDLPPGAPGMEDWPIHGELPWQEYKELARWLIVRDRAMELVRQELGQFKPTVQLLAWDLTSDPVTVSWSGSHPLGWTLRYDVTLEYPNGRAYPLATGTTARSLQFPAGRLPGGSNLTLRVIARAGIHSAQDQATGLAVPNRKPEVVLQSPTQGESFGIGATIALIAFARDPEDGLLTGSRVTWTSDRDGALGTGTSLDVVLSPGSHTLTVTATDSAGAGATAQVTVLVF